MFMKIFLNSLRYLERITSRQTFFLQRFLAKTFNIKISTVFKRLTNGLKERNADKQNFSNHFASSYAKPYLVGHKTSP